MVLPPQCRTRGVIRRGRCIIVNLAATTDQDVLQVADTVIKTFRQKANFFRRVTGRAEVNEDGALGKVGTGKNFMVDSRTDSTLPAHFFQYAQFDQQSSVVYSSRLAANKYFGRGGKRLEYLIGKTHER